MADCEPCQKNLCRAILTPNGIETEGKAGRKAKGENPNPLFAVPVTMETRNNSKVPLNALNLPSSFTYDIPTKAGQTVNIKN